MIKREIHFLTALLLLVSAAGRAGTVLHIDVGTEPEAAVFGFGWWRSERNPDRTFRWIRFHMEADCWVDLPNTIATPSEVEIQAASYFHPRRAQRLALYINDQFVAEWRFPHKPDWTFLPLRAVVPAGIFRRGRNRLVLRVGYLGDRGYAVAVDHIRLLNPAARELSQPFDL